ncbi:unnamed protein product [Litomosoides sigmodontis]|uniref:C2H2-type domain-containing protein n=1 Tax=Litomosoides sigmodontis TaxID=42156 RepID=A0A3P6TUI6_LITSI|nr:unnamed protein product [Litomosoides sigmodontis]
MLLDTVGSLFCSKNFTVHTYHTLTIALSLQAIAIINDVATALSQNVHVSIGDDLRMQSQLGNNSGGVRKYTVEDVEAHRKQFKCQPYDKQLRQLKDRGHLAFHLKPTTANNHGKLLQCYLCDMRFVKFNSLRKHFETHIPQLFRGIEFDNEVSRNFALSKVRITRKDITAIPYSTQMANNIKATDVLIKQILSATAHYDTVMV